MELRTADTRPPGRPPETGGQNAVDLQQDNKPPPRTTETRAAEARAAESDVAESDVAGQERRSESRSERAGHSQADPTEARHSVSPERGTVRTGRHDLPSRPDTATPAQAERQRWAERLDKVENPSSNRGELRDRLSDLPPGHPSSPWEEDGAPKPPAPRLRDVENPEPPLTDEAYATHLSEVRKGLEDAYSSGLRTDILHAVGPDHQEWSPERIRIHKAILDEKWELAAEIPCDHQAIIAGGLGGSGKSTVLRLHGEAADKPKFLTVDPDKFKQDLAERGLIPEVHGLSPMEASSLAHEESSYLAKQLALRARSEGKNIIWDVTMSSFESASQRIHELREAGYDRIDGVFVDIPIETSVARSESRHRRGYDLYLAGQGVGGRLVPAEVIRAQGDPEFGSINRRAFEMLKDRFNHWSLYDNSTEGRPAELIQSSDLKH